MPNHESPKEKMNLLTHFIAGYPDYESSLNAALGLIDGGAFALEMQIPFSDPSADGPVIESACRGSLKAGFRVEDAFRLLEEIKKHSDIAVYLMSYSGIVFNMGVRTFVKEAAASGAAGLIIPDLTPGADEGLYQEGRIVGLPVVPVIVPGISDSRLEEILSEKPEWIYLALRSGITGSYTKLDSEILGFLENLKYREVKIMAGFGIRSPGQVHTLMQHCDLAIAGSYIVKAIGTAAEDGQLIRNAAGDCVRFLTGKTIKK
jgi:tryptophan synthase alpha chain